MVDRQIPEAFAWLFI